MRNFLPSRSRFALGASTTAALLILSTAPAVRSGEKAAVQFESDVLPILSANCAACHGTQTRIKEMNLSTFDGVMKGSESGPVVVPGKPDESRLYQMVHEGKMPPGNKTGLPKEQIATIRAWIEAGAPSANKTSEVADTEEITEQEIVPVMYLRCTVCHGLRRQE